jgi:hypothetical protein
MQELLNREALSSTKISSGIEADCDDLSSHFDSSVFITEANTLTLYENTLIPQSPLTLRNSRGDDDSSSFFETEIVRSETICLQNSITVNYDNLVESPYNRRDEVSTHLVPPLIHGQKKPVASACASTATSSVGNKSQVKSNLIEYINSLKETTATEASTQPTTSAESDKGCGGNCSGELYKLTKSDKNADPKISSVREQLFLFIMTKLAALIKSETRLKEFRDYFVYLLKKHEVAASARQQQQLGSSGSHHEQFVQEAFQFFNNHLFCKLVSSVTIEWSNRLKS